MPKRKTKKTISIALLCFMMLGFLGYALFFRIPEGEASFLYTEDFTTTTYKDSENTTGVWNTDLNKSLLEQSWGDPGGVSEGFSNPIYSNGPMDALFDSSGNIYYAYADSSDSNKGKLMKFDGESWNLIKTVTTINSVDPSLAIDSNDVLYFAYRISGGVSVEKYESGSWSQVGDANIYPGTCTMKSLRLAVDTNDDSLYLGFVDGNNANKLTVMNFDGIVWDFVGGEGVSNYDLYIASSRNLNLYARSGVLYAGYLANNDTDDRQIQLMKYESGSWSFLGDPFAEGIGDYMHAMLDSSNNFYVVYEDTFSRVKVAKYDSAWSDVGGVLSDGNSGFLTGAISSNDEPYAFYRYWTTSAQAVVKKYEDGSWIDVGEMGFNEASFSYPVMKLDVNDIPYVFYRDYGNDYKATMKKYGYFTPSQTIQSTTIDETDSPITSVKMTVTDTQPTDTDITYYISRDGGITWTDISESVTEEASYHFNSDEPQGSDLRWKAVLESTNTSLTPELSGVEITYTIPSRRRDFTPPEDVSDVSITQYTQDDTDNNAKLKWINPDDSDLNSIEIYRGTQEGITPNEHIASMLASATTEFIDLDLDNETRYYYSFVTIDNFGNRNVSQNVYSFSLSDTSEEQKPRERQLEEEAEEDSKEEDELAELEDPETEVQIEEEIVTSSIVPKSNIIRNLDEEIRCIGEYGRNFGKMPSNGEGWRFVNLCAYGRQNQKRSLSREVEALSRFVAKFKRVPVSSSDWNILAALAYYTD